MTIVPSSIADLPETVPVFPLQGALLLPRGKLPLNIFEPRYLAMVDDALASDRIIGMIQPQVKEKTEAEDKPDLYTVGCAGKIVTFAETDDGRYLISLTGMSRFRGVEELPLKTGYRRMRVDFSDFASDLAGPDDSAIDRDRVLAAIKGYLSRRQLGADWESITKTRTGDLVSVMAMVCPFSAVEKQALLEASSAVDRAEAMVTLMEMDRNEDEPPGPVN